MTPTTIKTELLKAGITQAAIARQMNVKPPNISKVIAGSIVSHRLRCAIADAIGRSVTDIWPDAAPRKPGRPKQQ